MPVEAQIIERRGNKSNTFYRHPSGGVRLNTFRNQEFTIHFQWTWGLGSQCAPGSWLIRAG